MLHSRLKIIQASAAQANKAALETEKQRDELHTQIEEIEEELQPKRARSDADAGDAHEILAEVDNWDLSDHRREGTRVQNRRNVQGMLACARARTWIPVEWPTSLGGRLYAY